MTGQSFQPLTDERLDRLMSQVLADRADAVAFVALPSDAVAERIGAGLRPTHGMRAGLLLLAVLGLLLVAIAAAAVIGSRPVPPVPMTFQCVTSAPELGQIEIRDATGIASGCRLLTTDAAVGIREAMGPPLTSLDASTVEISSSRGDSRGVLVLWVVANCDGPARIDLSGDASQRIDVAVRQQRAGPCMPGTGLGALEISTTRPISPEDMFGSVIRVESPL
jgi:hypothetical protein